jgi:tRNA (cytidine/uridine-2'-O-)-methyltransferase
MIYKYERRKKKLTSNSFTLSYCCRNPTVHSMFNIVMVHPEIPHNTGAAGRLALATGATLHLIEPLGFEINDKAVKRAGLDYWKDVTVKTWSSWEEFEMHLDDGSRLFMLTTKSSQPYWNKKFKPDDYLVFGRETKGLNEDLIRKYADNAITIPMTTGSTRSLNLATSIGIVLYEAVRQNS